MKKKSRRTFLKLSAAASGALMVPGCMNGSQEKAETTLIDQPFKGPLIISTWNHGLQANAKAWEVLQKGGSAIDAAEQGVRVAVHHQRRVGDG